MVRYLSTDQAKEFYDRAGSKKTSQNVYEDLAITDLIAHSSFESATHVFEFGCGRGQLAEKLLRSYLKPPTKYFGVDVSPTMLALADTRLRPYKSMVTLLKTNGTLKLDLPDGTFDRFISTFVLDLFSPDDITLILREAHRLLVSGKGYLCLANLTRAKGMLPRIIMSFWTVLFKFSPKIVGGCRPLDIRGYITPPDWQIEYTNVIVSRGVPTQVLVARKLG